MTALTLAMAVHLAACESEKADVSMLMNPSELTATAPDQFHAHFETSKGDFVIEVNRDWAPIGADRFFNLVSAGYYDDVRFFRVIMGFMAQFGIHGDPDVADAWRYARIPDDQRIQSNTRGMVSYAMAGPDTRTTQVFINFGDNSALDSMNFAPFGQVVEGMEVVDQIYAEYGDAEPRGRGPLQRRLQSMGNNYLKVEFPELDYVVRATIVDESGDGTNESGDGTNESGDGTNGTGGADGTDGADGTNDTDGTEGTSGADGTSGAEGTDG